MERDSRGWDGSYLWYSHYDGRLYSHVGIERCEWQNLAEYPVGRHPNSDVFSGSVKVSSPGSSCASPQERP